MAQNNIPCRDDTKALFRELKRAKAYIEDEDYSDNDLLRELVERESRRLEIHDEVRRVTDDSDVPPHERDDVDESGADTYADLTNPSGSPDGA